MTTVLQTRRPSRPVRAPSPIDHLISSLDTDAFRALMIGAAAERADYGHEAGTLQHIHDLLATAAELARQVKARIAEVS